MNGSSTEAQIRKEKRKIKARQLWGQSRGRTITRKGMVRKLDKAFSESIRNRDQKLRGHCAFGPEPIECCFHFITRAKYSTRWLPINAVGSCFGHNNQYEYDPHFAIKWFVDTYGLDSYEQLIREGNRREPLSDIELKSLYDKFITTIKEKP